MSFASPPVLSRWELAAETIALKIRWFGILFGYLLVNVEGGGEERVILNAILALGAVYALLDTAFSLKGRVFLGQLPLAISAMEALFIALLCYYYGGLESPFRFYYILSLICCAIRYSSRVTYYTWALHAVSYLLLYAALPVSAKKTWPLVLTLVLLGWITWASAAMALLLKRIGEHLGRLNAALEENRSHLEARIAERTRQLQEAQAQMLHQEKVAAFGLLAAGIAHEVGNPLTSISSMVQMLQRRPQDEYGTDKLALVSDQLQRIQAILRELVQFSRPASTARGRVHLHDVVQEALNITKYYSRTKGRQIDNQVSAELPPVWGVRDQLVQVVFNLILNAIDATAPGGCVKLRAREAGDDIDLSVHDDGAGIAPEHAPRLFQPYFTTKKHGTGLGLFVTRKLVVEHGGRIDFTSPAGQGTTFCVHLPAAALPPSPLYSGERAGVRGTGSLQTPAPSPQPLSPEHRGEGLSISDS